MLFCFRCSADTKIELDRLVASGAYRDHGEVIAAAVLNLALMEKEFGSNGQVIVSSPGTGSDRPLALHKPARAGIQPKKEQRSLSADSLTAVDIVPIDPQPAIALALAAERSGEVATEIVAPEVPIIFRRVSLPATEPKDLAHLPADMWRHGQDVPLDRWILGQFNRLLPAKANARALIHLFAERKFGLKIDEAANLVASEALSLGDYLAAIDEREKVARDDALSTAFPQRKKDAEKARTRYANQFVVYQNGRGELSGLMIDLKLINVDIRRRERLIVPTRTAWEFAKLENPILDNTRNGAAQKFSDQEKGFLTEHIMHGVPVESFAYRAILETVMNGDNTPEKIDAGLKEKYVSKVRAEQVSQSFLTSQRSGAISRMSDLGLIERLRDGVRVTYGVTKEGERFLSQYMNLLKG